MIGNPLDPQNILKETGRGIFILRSIMDDVEFFHLPDGTEVKITKKIKSAE
jgi:serine/threonine-protein kinase RsbW